MAQNLLKFDIVRDLQRVDGFLTRLLSDSEIQKRFFYNPSRVMIELGFHDPTTNKAIGITNRIFYATLMNRRLVRYAIESAPKLDIPPEIQQKYINGLDKGRVQFDNKIGQLAIDAYLKDEKRLRTMILTILKDINRRRILKKNYSAKEIEAYVGKVMQSIRERRPVRDIPLLERFGPGYGIGRYVGLAEADADSSGTDSSGTDSSGTDSSGTDSSGTDSSGSETSGTEGDNNVAVVEVVGFATVVLPIAVFIPVLAFGDPDPGAKIEDPWEQINAGIVQAYQGDPSGLRASATLIRLLLFASDMALYVQRIERTGFYGSP